MKFELPPLPYDFDALSPHLSKKTMEFHYGKHHQGYVNKLNAALEESPRQPTMDLEELIRSTKGSIFNNAAQVWNHTFFWNCMSPSADGEPKGAIGEAIRKHFDSFENFKEEFVQKGKTLFGSGWTWLVKKKDGSLSIEQTKDAENPLILDQKPLLTCDVWEHAYYLDYQNERGKYLDAFWNVVNWEFVESQLQGVQEPVLISQKG